MSIEIALFLASGLAALFIGAEGLIRGASALALRIGIAPLVVGLTVVAFGTSTPELVVSLKAAMIGNSSIALGNAVGSNIANIALILGISALVRPLDVHASIIRREIPIMIGASFLLVLLLLDGELGPVDGLIFVVGIVIYTAVNVMLARKEKNAEVDQEFKEGLKTGLGGPVSVMLVAGGLGLMILGASLFVNSSIAVAKAIGVSDAVIGLTIVAAGTSLPELVTAVVAAYRNKPDIAIGNVVGSNIFNILGILGLAALMMPVSSSGMNAFDYGAMIVAAMLLLPLSKTGARISRLEGLLLVLGYSAYIYLRMP